VREPLQTHQAYQPAKYHRPGRRLGDGGCNDQIVDVALFSAALTRPIGACKVGCGVGKRGAGDRISICLPSITVGAIGGECGDGLGTVGRGRGAFDGFEGFAEVEWTGETAI